MAGFGRREDLDELRDDRPGQRAAGDDGRELPPEVGVPPEGRDEPVRRDIGEDDRHNRRQPHQTGQRHLEVHRLGVAEAGFRPHVVEQVRRAAGDDHDDAHDEDPDEELDLDRGVGHRHQDEGDERDTGHAVGLEAVGARPDRVARVVAGAVGDDAGIAHVVFLDVEDNLHQIGADVGDLREDAAGDSEHRGAERLADGEADEAGAGIVAGNEEQDAEHQEQLDADEQHADAHPGAERNGVDRKRHASQAGERGARVGERVDADAEPRHAVAAGDADEAEEQDDGDLQRVHVLEHAEVDHHDRADEQLEEEDELALGDEIRLAGLVNELGDVPHRLVNRQVLEPGEDHEAERESAQAHDQARHQQGAAIDAMEIHRPQIRQHQVRFTARVGRRGLRGWRALHCSGSRLQRRRRGDPHTEQQHADDRGKAGVP